MNAMVTAPTAFLCPNCRTSNLPSAKFCINCGFDMFLNDDQLVKYRITKVIKAGGQGIVYKAWDTAGRECAVKEMRDNFATAAERADGIERFQEEADLLKRLQHPAVPKVYASFIDDNRYYLAMEFIYGEDLEDRVKREGAIAEATVLRWAGQICDVLQFMHNQGLIYRDMKPSNLMITSDTNIKMIDFGIAKLLQPGQRNTMIGTPGYAPPEQYQGLANAKSDIYALAATLHHLLTGRDPREHAPFSFPPARDEQPRLAQRTSDALEKALSLDEASRFQTIGEFRRALPIPASDREPTAPFDMSPMPQTGATQRIEEPRFPPAAPLPSRPFQSRAQPDAPPSRPQATPKAQQATPKTPQAALTRPQTASPKPAPKAKPHRRRGGFIGGVVRTTLFVGALAVGGTYAAPTVAVPLIQQYVPAVMQYLPQDLVQRGLNPQVTPAPPAPSGGFALSPPLIHMVRVKVPVGQAPTIEQLREAFLQRVQVDYPGAQFSAASPPATLGSAQPVGDPVDGLQTYEAEMTGRTNIPR